LETIFSATPCLATKGSFESICFVYELMLCFLSIAYELVAGAFLDLAESGLVKGDKAGVELYNDMVSVFSQVVSPFANYQQRFEELEGKYLQSATSLVSKDMQQVAIITKVVIWPRDLVCLQSLHPLNVEPTPISSPHMGNVKHCLPFDFRRIHFEMVHGHEEMLHV
jgi:hypothetical protein